MPKINLPPGWSEANVRALFEVSKGKPESGKRATPKQLNAFIKSQRSSFERGPRGFPGVERFQQRPGSPTAPGGKVSATRPQTPKSRISSPPPVPPGISVSKAGSPLATAHTQRAAMMIGHGQARLAKAQAQLPRMDLLSTPHLKKQRVGQAVQLLKAARSCCSHARASAEAGGDVSLSTVSTLEAQINDLAKALRAKVDTRPARSPRVTEAEQQLRRKTPVGAPPPGPRASQTDLKAARAPQAEQKQPAVPDNQHRITGVQIKELKKLFSTKLNLADKAQAQQKAAHGLSRQATTRTDLVAAKREVCRARGLAGQAKAELQQVSNALVLKWSALQGRIDPREHGQFIQLRGQIQEAQALCRGWEDELAATNENLSASILKIDRKDSENELFAEGSEASLLMAQATGEVRLQELGDPVVEQIERRLKALKGDAPSDAEIIRRLHSL